MHADVLRRRCAARGRGTLGAYVGTVDPSRALVFALSIAATTLLACGGSSIHVRVAGSGTLTPSTGPVAAGPLGPPGRLAVEGTFTQNVLRPTTTASATPAGEARTVQSILGARLIYTFANHVELGASLQVADANWSGLSVTGDAVAPYDARALFGGGLQLRALVAGTPSRGFGLSAEISLFQAPYGERQYDLLPSYSSGSSAPSVLSRDTTDVHGVATLVEPNLGAFGTFRLAPHLYLLVGGTAGLRHAVETTYTYDATCGPSADVGPCTSSGVRSPFGNVLGQLTAYASLGYSVGPATFFVQVAGNAFGEAPFGATVGVRLTPGWDGRDGPPALQSADPPAPVAGIAVAPAAADTQLERLEAHGSSR